MTKKDIKGKSKCKFDAGQNSPNLKSYTTGHSLFGMDSTTESQNRCRLSIKKRTASTSLDFAKFSDSEFYDSSNTASVKPDSTISCLDFSHIQSGTVLDFGHCAFQPPYVNVSSDGCPSFQQDFLLSSDEFSVPISDDPYQCFFKQLGSVPTQGECSSAHALQNTTHDIHGSSVTRLGDTVKTAGVSTLPDLATPVTLDFQRSVISEQDATQQDSFVIDSELLYANEFNISSSLKNVRVDCNCLFEDIDFNSNGHIPLMSSKKRKHNVVDPTPLNIPPLLLASEDSVVYQPATPKSNLPLISSKLLAANKPCHQSLFQDTACASNGYAASRLPKKTKNNVTDSCAAKRYLNENGSPPHSFPDSGSEYRIIHGVTSLYRDIGDCNRSCKHCGAKFWYGEGLKKTSATNQPLYNKCCLDGKVRLPAEQEPPSYIKELLQNRQFMKNIRAYNQMFSMTSFGAHVDDSINNGRGPYIFKISGQIYHWIGKMCPSEGDPPRFLQLYIYDTENEVENRMRHFGGLTADGLSTEIVERLIQLLDEQNELVRVFRTAKNKCQTHPIPDFKLRLYSVVGAREYDLPTSQTLGAIVFQEVEDTNTDYDVIIESRGGPPQRINKLHKSYMSLQFPLIFIYGQPGFHPEMKLAEIGNRRRLSMNMFYTYQLHERLGSYGTLFRSGRLFQQYVVGVYCCIEQNRMDFYREHQNDIRKEYLSGIYDAISRGDRVGSDIGGKIILPRSFTGGPRYMYSHYLDALAICRELGNPQFFITFTCNVNWPEIKRHMEDFPELLPSDRADVVRVFQQKINDFLCVSQAQAALWRCNGP